MQFSSLPRYARTFVIDAQSRVTKQIDRSKRKSRRIVKRIKNEKIPHPIWIVGYPIMMLGSCLFFVLFLFRRIKIIDKHRLPYWTAPLLMISNHPSFWEAYLLPFIFGWRSLWVRFLPYSMPDASNFSGKFWSLCRFRFILVPRKIKNAIAKAIRRVISLIRHRAAVVIAFVETGRTSSGTNIAFDHGGPFRMRKVGSGVPRIVEATKVPVTLFFVEDSDKVCPRGRRYPTWENLITLSTTITVGITIRYEDYDFTGCKTRPMRVNRIREHHQAEFEKLALECKARREKREQWKRNLSGRYH